MFGVQIGNETSAKILKTVDSVAALSWNIIHILNNLLIFNGDHSKRSDANKQFDEKNILDQNSGFTSFCEFDDSFLT